MARSFNLGKFEYVDPVLPLYEIKHFDPYAIFIRLLCDFVNVATYKYRRYFNRLN